MLDEGVHDFFVAGDVEMDCKLVVFDRSDRAVAKFLVKNPAADRKTANPSHFLTPPRSRIGAGQQGAALRGGR